MPTDWLHFLIYAAAAAIPLLVWKRRIGLLLAVAIGVTGLILSDRVINLFGVAAGTLLALNILTLRSSSKPPSDVSADHSHSSLP